MAKVSEQIIVAAPQGGAFSAVAGRTLVARAYLRRNQSLAVGLVLLLLLLAIGVVGPLFVDVSQAVPLSALPSQPPSAEYPLGTDDAGRNLLAVVVVGLPLTMQVGFLAGAVGIGLGIVLGLIAGYVGGWVDNLIRGVVDILLTVPGLVVLITIAASLKGVISIPIMALVVAILAWMWPTRTIRAQVLSLREQPFVQMAKLSGTKGWQIIFLEMMPNMLPYLAASFVGSVSHAILASVGLEALGLGPQNEPTLGMTIYWAISFTALIRGMWWWWLTPIVLIVLLFIALFLISAGLDEIANPRVRRRSA